MHRRCLVIGLGSFGRAVALHLVRGGAEVIVLDKNREKIEAFKDEVATAIVADATDERALRNEQLQDVHVAVVAIGETFEELLLCTVHLLNMGIPRVITRAFTPTQRLILEKLGVHEIVSPEEEAGQRLAERILHPTFRTYIPLPGNYEIVEVPAPSFFVGRTLRDLDLLNRYRLTLVTIKRIVNREPVIIGCVRPHEKIQKDDALIVMGHQKDIQRFLEAMGENEDYE